MFNVCICNFDTDVSVPNQFIWSASPTRQYSAKHTYKALYRGLERMEGVG